MLVTRFFIKALIFKKNPKEGTRAADFNIPHGSVVPIGANVGTKSFMGTLGCKIY